MFGTSSEADLFDSSAALDAIADLARNTNDAILAQRSSERLEIRAKVVVRPANSSERRLRTMECVTADISNGGCMLLTPAPLLPGDMFWLEFDSSQIRIGALFARCLRCRFVREDIFEVGFRFLNNISLSNAVVPNTSALL